jgi:hypothetical protein
VPAFQDQVLREPVQLEFVPAVLQVVLPAFTRDIAPSGAQFSSRIRIFIPTRTTIRERVRSRPR